MSVLDEHETMKARLGRDPGRTEVATSLGLKSKSAIQGHIDKLISGGLVEKGRRGVIHVTVFGQIMLARYRTRGAVE